MREVFLVAVAVQEVVARIETVQEALACAIPLQEEVVTHVVAVREVLARAVAGWWVGGAPAVVATREV